MWGNRFAVGAAAYEWPGGGTGAAFLYQVGAGGLTTPELTLPLVTATADGVGGALSAHGVTLVATSPGTMMSPVWGRVHIYGLRTENGDPCTSDDDCLSRFCTDGVCCDSRCGDGDPIDCMVCSAAAGAVADGTCSPAPASPGIVCRPAAGPCDVGESCDGASDVCPEDAFATAAVECRASVGPCDSPESCTGIDAPCPDDLKLGPEVECRASTGACDPAEYCDGLADICAVDLGGPCAPDAGMELPDAGAARMDAGSAEDAGSEGESAAYGCSCRAAANDRRLDAPLGLLSVFVVLFARRRRGECGLGG